jgi:large subunit ribosomal protein L29
MKDSYKDLTAEELKVKREELRKAYNDARFNAVIGHVDNPLGERNIRKKLARVHTLIREFETGIRTKAEPKTARPAAAAPAAAGAPAAET